MILLTERIGLVENMVIKRIQNNKDFAIDINRETKTVMGRNQQRLHSYYKGLLALYDETLSEEQDKALRVIVDNMMDSAAGKLLRSMDSDRVDEICIYRAKLNKEEMATAEALLEVIDATMDDPELESVIINGNKFLYEDGSINVDKHLAQLEQIGDRVSGETLMIYENEDGELVVY